MYFESFKQEYDLSSANVVVTDASKGSDPVSVVRYAEKLFKASQKDNNAFDRVFCVFDKDQHGNYDTAVQMLSKGNSKFTAITSVLVLSIGLSCTLTIPRSLSRLPLPLLPN